jgi:hypothetical protein
VYHDPSGYPQGRAGPGASVASLQRLRKGEGTAGLVLATAIGEAFVGDDPVIGTVLTVAAALSFGLLTVQYALFTAAITTFVVLMSTTVGEGAFRAAGQRATGTVLGTVLGIAIAFIAWRLWPNSGSAVDLAGQPTVGGAES